VKKNKDVLKAFLKHGNAQDFCFFHRLILNNNSYKANLTGFKTLYFNFSISCIMKLS